MSVICLNFYFNRSVSLLKNKVEKFDLKTLDLRYALKVSAPSIISHVALGMSGKLSEFSFLAGAV